MLTSRNKCKSFLSQKIHLCSNYLLNSQLKFHQALSNYIILKYKSIMIWKYDSIFHTLKIKRHKNLHNKNKMISFAA
jgi:hypothetical protein